MSHNGPRYANQSKLQTETTTTFTTSNNPKMMDSIKYIYEFFLDIQDIKNTEHRPYKIAVLVNQLKDQLELYKQPLWILSPRSRVESYMHMMYMFIKQLLIPFKNSSRPVFGTVQVTPQRHCFCSRDIKGNGTCKVNTQGQLRMSRNRYQRSAL